MPSSSWALHVFSHPLTANLSNNNSQPFLWPLTKAMMHHTHLVHLMVDLPPALTLSTTLCLTGIRCVSQSLLALSLLPPIQHHYPVSTSLSHFKSAHQLKIHRMP